MDEPLTVFLGGDVMTGRGVDQILPCPGDPRLWERYVRDARTYVELAEQANGAVPRPVGYAWPWGDALSVIDEVGARVRLVNLETSVTVSSDVDLCKGVHYRMNPANVPCLTAARLDVCSLANNHVLDFGARGLSETVSALSEAGVAVAGVGWEPAVVPFGSGRLVVFSFGDRSSGIPASWAGLAVLPDLSDGSADSVVERVHRVKRAGDVVVASVHWGSNWGYEVSEAQVRFARRIVDGGVDVVHGHSSHHPRPVCVYRGRLVLFGCGDLVDDYEGIGGHEEFQPDLRVLYFAGICPKTGRLVRLRMVPVRARRMRLCRVPRAEVAHVGEVLNRISVPFGSRIEGSRVLELRV